MATTGDAYIGGSQHARQKYLPAAGGEDRLAICLTGSGIRAVGYLSGAIERLNEFGLLSKATTISAVGAGAIVAGTIARAWPMLRTSDDGRYANFDDCVTGPLNRLATQGIRIRDSFFERFRPRNWSKWTHRDWNKTDLLASVLDRRLYRGALLKQLKTQPSFWFAGVHATTGGSWYYRTDQVGDPLLGFTAQHRIRLSEAVAASAADPVEFPPMVHRLSPRTFESSRLGVNADRLRQKVQIFSGMLNDTLALQPVWRTHQTVIVCDGGTADRIGIDYEDWIGNRLHRSLHVNQSALADSQKRQFVQHLLAGSFAGAYCGLSTYHGNYGLAKSTGYPADVVDEIGRLPSNVSALSREQTMVLANHGYTIADTAIKRYLPNFAAERQCTLPFPKVVDRGRILASMRPGETTKARRAA